MNPKQNVGPLFVSNFDDKQYHVISTQWIWTLDNYVQQLSPSIPTTKIQSTEIADNNNNNNNSNNNNNNNNNSNNNNNNINRSETDNNSTVNKDEFYCTSCRISFPNVEKFKDHYRSDLHVLNLKLKMENAAPISEPEYLQLKSQDLGSSQELGEDQEFEEDHEKEYLEKVREEMLEEERAKEKKAKNRRNTPKILLQSGTSKLTLHRKLFPKEALVRSAPDLLESQSLISDLQKITRAQNCAVFMCCGGFFAGAVFQGPVCVLHRTFHKYTVRRKQGGSQSNKDNQSATSAPKSAGSSLRRYNFVKLTEDIQKTLAEWKLHLEKCDYIFLFAPSFNRQIFLADKSLFASEEIKAKIRGIPFTTKRPSFIECKRIHQILMSTEFVKERTTLQSDVPEIANEPAKQDPKKKKKKKKKKATAEQPPEPVAPKQSGPITFEWNPFLSAIAAQNFSLLSELISTGAVFEIPETIEPEKIEHPLTLAVSLGNEEIINLILSKMNPSLNAQSPCQNFQTAIHVAASLGRKKILSTLLETYGAKLQLDLRDGHGKTAYEVSKSKAVKEIFQNYAGQNPELTDWKKLNIPLLNSQIQEKKKEHQKKKNQKKKENQKEKNAQKKEEQLRQKDEEERRRIIQENVEKKNNLTPREKMLLAAENRYHSKKCSWCQQHLVGIPFTRYDFEYCTTDCLWEHKKKLGK